MTIDLEQIDRLAELAASLPAPVRPWRSPSGHDWYLMVPSPVVAEAVISGAHPSHMAAIAADDGSWCVAVFADGGGAPVLIASPDVAARLRACTVDELRAQLKAVLIGREEPASDQRQDGPDEGS